MTIRSKTLYIALHGTIFKVFPNNTVIHNNDKISGAHIVTIHKRPHNFNYIERPVYKQLRLEYKDGSRYTVDLERLILLRTMKVTDEMSDDI